MRVLLFGSRIPGQAKVMGAGWGFSAHHFAIDGRQRGEMGSSMTDRDWRGLIKRGKGKSRQGQKGKERAGRLGDGHDGLWCE